MRGFECVQEELRGCVEWVCVGGGWEVLGFRGICCVLEM